MPVVNIRAMSANADVVRVDRQSGLLGEGGWGNPFRIGPDGSRDEVIAKYRALLWDLCNGRVQAVGRRFNMADLRALNGRTLACWCAPKPCHADVLLRAAAWAEEQPEAHSARSWAAKHGDLRDDERI